MANRRGGEIDKKYWFVYNACSKTIEAGESTIASIRLEVLFFFSCFYSAGGHRLSITATISTTDTATTPGWICSGISISVCIQRRARQANVIKIT